MNRWPAVLLVIVMAVALIAIDRQASTTEEAEPGEPTAQPTGPQSAALDSSGSTWYCPAGRITPDVSSDHVVVVSNPTREVAVGTLTVYPSREDPQGNSLPEPRAVQNIEVPAGGQTEISLSPLVVSLDDKLATNDGAFVAALVESDASGIRVEHRFIGNQGSDIGPCATTAATTWWFASGTTTADVQYQLYVLNPFPDDAVIDVSFVTDDGSRSPTVFNGRLVPAQSLTVLQVEPEVAVNAQVTAEIDVLSGRVIAERVQLFSNEAGPSGLSLSLGSNRLSTQWFFPAGRSVPGAGESYVIYNPGETEAEVEFELKPDSADRAGDVAPLPVPVGPRQRWIVTVRTHATHPVDALASIDATSLVDPNEPFFVSVRSFNEVPVVAERVVTRPLGDGGVTASLGIDAASTDQAFALPPGILTAESAVVGVLNPAGNTIAQVEVLVGGPGGEVVVTTVEVAPRRRAVLDLQNFVDDESTWMRLRSRAGTIAELTMTIDGVVLSTTAIPVQGSLSTPDLFAFE